MTNRLLISCLSALLLLGSLCACTREQQPGEREEVPVMISMSTKATLAGDRTFRVLLFANNRDYSGRSGSYCTRSFTWTDDYTDPSAAPVNYSWLMPCKVDAAGQPLDAGDNVVDLDAADHDSSNGLRWNNGGSSWTGNVHLVALSPAVDFVTDDSTPGPADRLVWQNLGHAVWLNWTPNTAVYISEPVSGGFSGVWFAGKYVYNSTGTDLSATLVDHRATIAIQIQCDNTLIPSAIIRSVEVENRIVTDRFYLEDKEDEVRGFSRPAHPHYTLSTSADALDNSTDPLPKEVKIGDDPTNPSDPTRVTWISDTEYYLAARDYSPAEVSAIRPRIVVKLGPDASDPIIVKVPLDQNLEPMKHYTYILKVANTYVHVYAIPGVSWESTGAGGGTAVSETPAYLGAVKIGGTDGKWESGGGGDAEKPVTP